MKGFLALLAPTPSSFTHTVLHPRGISGPLPIPIAHQRRQSPSKLQVKLNPGQTESCMPGFLSPKPEPHPGPPTPSFGPRTTRKAGPGVPRVILGDVVLDRTGFPAAVSRRTRRAVVFALLFALVTALPSPRAHPAPHHRTPPCCECGVNPRRVGATPRRPPAQEEGRL